MNKSSLILGIFLCVPIYSIKPALLSVDVDSKSMVAIEKKGSLAASSTDYTVASSRLELLQTFFQFIKSGVVLAKSKPLSILTALLAFQSCIADVRALSVANGTQSLTYVVNGPAVNFLPIKISGTSQGYQVTITSSNIDAGALKSSESGVTDLSQLSPGMRTWIIGSAFSPLTQSAVNKVLSHLYFEPMPGHMKIIRLSTLFIDTFSDMRVNGVITLTPSDPTTSTTTTLPTEQTTPLTSSDKTTEFSSTYPQTSTDVASILSEGSGPLLGHSVSHTPLIATVAQSNSISARKNWTLDSSKLIQTMMITSPMSETDLPMRSLGGNSYLIIGGSVAGGLVVCCGTAAALLFLSKKRNNDSAQEEVAQECGIVEQVVNSESCYAAFSEMNSARQDFRHYSQLKASVEPTSHYHSLPRSSHQEQYDASHYLTIHKAAQGGDLAGLEIVLGLGVSINTVDDDGNTALHVAADREDYGMCKELIKRGADRQIKNALNMTAGEIARVNGNQGLFEFLS